MFVAVANPMKSRSRYKDEGRGFDTNKIAHPTAPENIGSVHGRGIYLMKALMDEERFRGRWSCRSCAKERRPSCSQMRP